jgi:aspartyl/asparaginyl beta-hydroxylase (cupin superfamily)
MSIYLRAARKPFPPGVSNGNDVHESHDARMAAAFPRTLAWCQGFARAIDGSLGRVALVSLQPRGRVYPHVDHGAYYAARDRYHLVIDSRDGSPLVTEDETAVLAEGELWVFDNKKRHEARNDSDLPRVHLIFDVEPAPGRGHYVPSASSLVA